SRRSVSYSRGFGSEESMCDSCMASLLGTLEREGKHLVHVRRAARTHDEPVETERDARALGQAVFERGEKTFVDRMCGQAAPRAFLQVVLEARTLLGRIRQFVESVRQLDAVEVRLETRRDLTADLCQGCLRGGVVVDERQALVPERRSHD